MRDQIIVTLGREFGSGGHKIAEIIAERFKIKLLDKELLESIVKSTDYTPEMLEKLDEKPRNLLFSRRVGSYSNSLEENIANSVFDLVRAEAEEGTSFVVVGRCAEYVLKNDPNRVSMFVCANMPDKVARVRKLYNLTESQAAALVKETDKKRKTYHNYYTDGKWGDARCYDICVNSSKLGIERTAEALITYIERFRSMDGKN